MPDNNMSPVAAFLALEYQDAEKAARAGRIDQAWHHLERARIVAQTRLLAHCRSHWTMLLFAARLGDWREGAGQIFRLALAPLGNLTGRLPVGNSGRANVSAFVAMEIPSDLRSILDTDSE